MVYNFFRLRLDIQYFMFPNNYIRLTFEIPVVKLVTLFQKNCLDTSNN